MPKTTTHYESWLIMVDNLMSQFMGASVSDVVEIYEGSNNPSVDEEDSPYNMWSNNVSPEEFVSECVPRIYGEYWGESPNDRHVFYRCFYGELSR